MSDIPKQQKMQVVALSESGNEVRIYLNEKTLQEHLKECGNLEKHIHIVMDMHGNLKGIRELA